MSKLLFVDSNHHTHNPIIYALEQDNLVVRANGATPAHRQRILDELAQPHGFHAVIVSDFEALMADKQQTHASRTGEWLEALSEKMPVIAYVKNRGQRLVLEKTLKHLHIPMVAETGDLNKDARALQAALTQIQDKTAWASSREPALQR